MIDGFSVFPGALRRSATVWNEQAEDLRAGGERLRSAQAAAASLGETAGPAATTFFQAWSGMISRHAAAADRRGAELSIMSSTYVVLDDEAAAKLSAIVSWADRDWFPPITDPHVRRPGQP